MILRQVFEQMKTLNYKFQSDKPEMRNIKAVLILIGLLGYGLTDIAVEDNAGDNSATSAYQTQVGNQEAANNPVANIPMVPALVNKNGYYFQNPPVRFQNYVDISNQNSQTTSPQSTSQTTIPLDPAINQQSVTGQLNSDSQDMNSTDSNLDPTLTSQSPVSDSNTTAQETGTSPNENAGNLQRQADQLGANEESNQQANTAHEQETKQVAPLRTGGQFTVRGANLIQIVFFPSSQQSARKETVQNGGSANAQIQSPSELTDTQGWNIRSEEWTGHN